MHPVTRTLIERTPARLRPAVSLAVRTIDAAIADRLHGLASELAFWVVLSLPALLITAIAVASTLGVVLEGDWHAQLSEQLLTVAGVALTEQSIDAVVVPIVDRLLTDTSIGVASVAFLTTLWTASRAVKVVLVTLTLVYGRGEERSGFRARLVGFGLTLAALAGGTVLAPLLIAGPNLIATLDRLLGALDLSRLHAVWSAAYWPTVVVIVTLAIAALYHLGVPGGGRRWRDELPGAVLATVAWLAGSAGLRLYGAWIMGTDSIYGPLAGPIVVLLWLWLTGLAVLLGAELNAQRERLTAARAR